MSLPENESFLYKELKRKQKHSMLEKKRRERMDSHIQQLKNIVPSLRGQQPDKLQVLKATADYIEKLQDILRDLHQKDPELHLQGLLQQKNHTILTLLPNYKPISFREPQSPPSSCIDSDSERSISIMSVNNLLN